LGNDAAIVITVLSILAFLASYIIPPIV